MTPGSVATEQLDSFTYDSTMLEMFYPFTNRNQPQPPIPTNTNQYQPIRRSHEPKHYKQPLFRT